MALTFKNFCPGEPVCLGEFTKWGRPITLHVETLAEQIEGTERNLAELKAKKAEEDERVAKTAAEAKAKQNEDWQLARQFANDACPLEWCYTIDTGGVGTVKLNSHPATIAAAIRKIKAEAKAEQREADAKLCAKEGRNHSAALIRDQG